MKIEIFEKKIEKLHEKKIKMPVKLLALDSILIENLALARIKICEGLIYDNLSPLSYAD